MTLKVRQLMLVALVCSTIRTISSVVSFTADGVWDTASQFDCEHYMCSPNKFTWIPNYSQKFYDNVTACDALVEKGVRKIYFHGDSYMRQIYAAMLITLNGDYRYGSQSNPANSPQCEYHRQFNEKSCGTLQLNHHGEVCDGRILLDPLLIGLDKLDHCKNELGTVVLWSFGNYKLSRSGRNGVNNATMYQEVFKRDLCPLLLDKPTRYNGAIKGHSCSVWWIPTHYRVRAYFPDEIPKLVRRYNYKMRAFFDSGECGNVNYADVYNMTEHLGLIHPTEAAQMTYDGVHWGMEVNLIKAQIIINALLTSE